MAMAGAGFAGALGLGMELVGGGFPEPPAPIFHTLLTSVFAAPKNPKRDPFALATRVLSAQVAR